MHNYTRKDIMEMVEDEDVGFIRLQFTDIYGTMKNMAVTVSQLKKAMDNQCMFGRFPHTRLSRGGGVGSVSVSGGRNGKTSAVQKCAESAEHGI